MQSIFVQKENYDFESEWFAESLAESLKERSSTDVSRWVVQCRLYEHELKKVVKTKKPFVSPPNRRKLVEFAGVIVT